MPISFKPTQNYPITLFKKTTTYCFLSIFQKQTKPNQNKQTNKKQPQKQQLAMGEV